MSAYSKDNGVLKVPLQLQLHHQFPDMTRPRAVGCFSVNEKREFQNNAANAGYLYMPESSEFPLDLNAGISRVQRKTADSDYHDLLIMCEYIFHNQHHLHPLPGSPNQRHLHADFVTLRGLLRQIMCLPIESRSDFRMHAIRVNGNIYMTKIETELQRVDREQMSPEHVNMCSWGFKFEQYLTTNSPQEKPDTSGPVIESEELVALFQCKFGQMKLFYGAEMDCIKSERQLNLKDPDTLATVKFVELKTIGHNLNYRQKRSFDYYKSSNWWSQSFLVGIDTILAGERDKEGKVRAIKKFAVSEMPRNKPWSTSAMGKFLETFLKELKLLMETIDDPSAVVQLDYGPDVAKVTYTVLKNEQVKDILPKWYRNLLNGSTSEPAPAPLKKSKQS